MSDAMDDKPQISPENNWREVWHTNCPKWMEGYPKCNPTSGIFKRGWDFFEIPDGSLLRLYACCHCGVKAYAGLDNQRRVTVLTYREVLLERWVAGFKGVAHTLARATPEDRRDAIELLQAMGASQEEMDEGEVTLREMLSPLFGRLIVMVEKD